MQVLAIIAGSFIGTILAGLVKGRDMTQMFTERLAGVSITMGLGIGFAAWWSRCHPAREARARPGAPAIAPKPSATSWRRTCWRRACS